MSDEQAAALVSSLRRSCRLWRCLVALAFTLLTVAVASAAAMVHSANTEAAHEREARAQSERQLDRVGRLNFILGERLKDCQRGQ